jgi:Type II restriction enzyme SfiI
MFIDPVSLRTDLRRLEEIEKASLRLVTQAIVSFRVEAEIIFRNEKDEAQDIGEDITREALDKMGVSKIDQRLFGKMDYKRARYVFHPNYAVRQALFVDSKAEKNDGRGSATLQIAQTSLWVRQVRAGSVYNERGRMPFILTISSERFLTTTIFVKYNYNEPSSGSYNLVDIIVAALPNRMLQRLYNPNPVDRIWSAGRNAPTLGESFRTRLSFAKLARKSRWRVQTIPLAPMPFTWQD